MVTDEKSIKKLAKLIFKQGYSLGVFSGDSGKIEQGYELMIKHMIDTDIHDEPTKKLLEALLK